MELTGTGPWTGNAPGAIDVGLFTDGSVASAGITSLVATCGGTGGGAARMICSGTLCHSDPTPLPDDATAETTWDPCSGGAFTWEAQGELEDGYDRVCVGGVADGSGCSAGDELTGAGPWSGAASAAVVVSLATDGSGGSTGLTRLSATCDGPSPAHASIRCTGTGCASAPVPLPDLASAMTSFDPCAGGPFTWTAEGRLEPGIDRACAGGIATAGADGGCTAGDELTGDGPWSGRWNGAMVLSLATDDSVASDGFTLTAACGDTGGAGADLVPAQLTLPASARSGETIAIAYMLRNLGDVAAGPHSNRVFLSKDDRLDDGDEPICRDRVDAAPIGPRMRSLDCPIPAEIAPGTWRVVLLADAEDEIWSRTRRTTRPGSRSRSWAVLRSRGPPRTGAGAAVSPRAGRAGLGRRR